MAKISFKPRTGKDFFDFLKALSVDISTAKTWALENFVCIDDAPITVEQIAKLRNDVYIIITEKVFSTDVASLVEEDNLGITYEGVTIKRRPIHRDFITEIQAQQQNAKSRDNVDVIKYFLTKFFEVSLQELDALPYELVGYMFRECNSFLDSLTKPQHTFNIDNLFTDDTPGIASNVLDNLV